MPYVNPETVTSPSGKVKNLHVVYDSNPNEGGWSVASMIWEENPAVGIRWNGAVNESGKGNPQSRGHATWFIVPREIERSVLEAAEALKRQKHDHLLLGYQEMAADEEREAEAEEWSNALIGDAYEAR